MGNILTLCEPTSKEFSFPSTPTLYIPTKSAITIAEKIQLLVIPGLSRDES